MSDNFVKLFSENATQEVTTSARSLAGTAELTTLASRLMADCLKKIEADFTVYEAAVSASKTSHDAMDDLIEKVIDIKAQNVDFLKELTEETLESMMKSQQSKRSRTKSKIMTMDNYRAMMTAAFAEALLRLATGKVKNSSGPRRLAGQVTYTAEELEKLAADQVLLRKEIRNVQSKKSILKAKDTFSETDPKYAEILKAEEQLKSLKVGGASTTVVKVVDETKNRLAELMAQVNDISRMKPAEAKKLLEQIQQLTAPTQAPNEEAPQQPTVQDEPVA